ncbi:MAG: SIMPL domain-containing protein [Gammaproteobacteria bacterium]|nr:SIMPL domain-containing protein [Gammaproteobacteria bacterium]
MKHRLFLIFLAAYSAASVAEPELKGTPGELSSYLSGVPEKVFISGYGEIKANADKAVITLVVKTEDSKLSGAIKKNKEVRNTIRNVLKQKGIKPEYIKDSKFSSTPEYGFFGDKPNNYKVNNIVSIEIHTGEELEAASSLVDEYASVSLVSTRFEQSDKQKYENSALQKAIENANAKKAVYEKTLNIRLKLVNLSEQVIQAAPQHRLREAKLKAMSASYEMEDSMGGAGQSFGELTYISNVNLTLRIE